MKIHIISTGGTIISVPGADGLAPGDIGGVTDYLASHFPDHEFTFEVLMNLDSSNVTPEHWSSIAAAVWSGLDRSGGVIVTHGTDTMAYTSSALAFMLRGIRKPVTLTGSQIPFGDPHSDAPSNLDLAVAAVRSDIGGVTVSFGGQIINGVRAVKMNSSEMRAFESVGVPPIASLTAFGLDVSHCPRRPDEIEPRLENQICPDVFLLKLVPGARPEIFDALIGLGYKGVVVEAFGAGNVPCEGRDIARAVRRSVESGIPVVVRSQCPRGRLDMSAYETGRRLLEAGAISAGDMTTEATVAKLMWALGKTSEPSEVGKIFRKNFAGEIILSDQNR